MSAKDKVSHQKVHLQRIFSGYGVENPLGKEDFLNTVWNDKPKISLRELFAKFKKKQQPPKKPVITAELEDPFKNTDFTNSQTFDIRKWREREFLKANLHNGEIVCHRHLAHMKHFNKVCAKKHVKDNIRMKMIENSISKRPQ